MQNLSMEKLQSWRKACLEDPTCRAAMNAASNNGIDKVAINPERYGEDPFLFNIDLEQGEITNQKSSGRCWMFAAMNVMRNLMMRRFNLETFELSQAYPLFFDKLERCNAFFEHVLETWESDMEDRTVMFLFDDPLCDGGQWEMFANLVRKYGVVPKSAYPETFNSSNTYQMNRYLCKILRKYGLLLRDAKRNGVAKKELERIKTEGMQEVFNTLETCLGTPPETFDFIAYDKDRNLVEYRHMTPHSFFETCVGMDLDSYVSLIHAPTADKPFRKTYTIAYLENVVEGKQVKHLNLPVEELRKAALAQLKDGVPVWFGCDVGKNFDMQDARAMLDVDTKAYDALFGVDFSMTKEDALDYGVSQMTHAMTFTGVHVDEEGEPVRWKVENSWGDKSGYKGYITMSDSWFRQYMYQIVVHRKYLPKEVAKLYDQEPIVLKPWDPMGSLA